MGVRFSPTGVCPYTPKMKPVMPDLIRHPDRLLWILAFAGMTDTP